MIDGHTHIREIIRTSATLENNSLAVATSVFGQAFTLTVIFK